jgi:pimeloyl-ACP methyl ester carboxylesterase
MEGAAHRGGAGPPLVLLHGLTVSWRVWTPVLPALERHHEVLAPTLAGHRGGPPLPDPQRGVPALADALERTLDDAGIGTAHLAGNSLGGWVAVELARRGRARSVVALSPLGGFADARGLRRIVRTFRRFDGRVAPHRDRAARAMGRPGLRRLLLRSAMEHGDRVPVDLAVGMVDDMAATTVLAGMASFLETAPPYAAELPDGVRARVAWGARDRTLPFARYGAPWRDVLPGAEHVELPGCGHVPTWDDPGLVAATILGVSS